MGARHERGSVARHLRFKYEVSVPLRGIEVHFMSYLVHPVLRGGWFMERHYLTIVCTEYS
jgi:hypothetical protein